VDLIDREDAGALATKRVSVLVHLSALPFAGLLKPHIPPPPPSSLEPSSLPQIYSLAIPERTPPDCLVID
jgi:hypothetical protein